MSVPNLPALIVVLPLLAGITCGLLGRGGRAWLLTLVTTWVTFGLTVVLALDVDRALSGPDAADAITYAVGGWGASSELGLRIGIDLVVDRLNALVLMVVALIGAAVAPATLKTFGQDVPEDRRHFAYAAYLLCLTGLLGITITGDAFNLYVLLEISSLTTYALVALGRTRDRRVIFLEESTRTSPRASRRVARRTFPARPRAPPRTPVKLHMSLLCRPFVSSSSSSSARSTAPILARLPAISVCSATRVRRARLRAARRLAPRAAGSDSSSPRRSPSLSSSIPLLRAGAITPPRTNPSRSNRARRFAVHS